MCVRACVRACVCVCVLSYNLCIFVMCYWYFGYTGGILNLGGLATSPSFLTGDYKPERAKQQSKVFSMAILDFGGLAAVPSFLTEDFKPRRVSNIPKFSEWGFQTKEG